MSGIPEEHPDHSRPATGQEPATPVDSTVVIAHVIAEAIREGSSHDHVWTIIAVSEPEGTHRPIHPRLEVAPGITRVLLKCDICHIPEVQHLAGHWTRDQILGERREDDV